MAPFHFVFLRDWINSYIAEKDGFYRLCACISIICVTEGTRFSLCSSLCVYVCMHACMCVYVCIYVYIHTGVLKYTFNLSLLFFVFLFLF